MYQDINLMPMIAMRGVVGFPNTVINLEIARNASKVSVERAMQKDRMVFLAAQRDMRVEKPTYSQMAVLPVDERYGSSVLPAEMDDEEEGLYDHLVR